MSRLSYRSFAERNRQKKAAGAAKRAQAAEFQRAQALQAQAAKEREREMIMQANLQAQTAAGQMYAQNQYAAKADRSKMANDTTLRQRSRQDAIFNKRQEMDKAWNQNQIDTQQAGLNHVFDSRLKRLDHQSQMKRDEAQQGYKLAGNEQLNKFNLNRDEIQHRYGQDDTRLKQGFSEADAQRDRGWAEADQIDAMIKERQAAGWTLSEWQQPLQKKMNESKRRVLELIATGEWSPDGAEAKEAFKKIQALGRQLVPNEPPFVEQDQDAAWAATRVDEAGGRHQFDRVSGKFEQFGAAPRTGSSGSEKKPLLNPDKAEFLKEVKGIYESPANQTDTGRPIKSEMEIARQRLTNFYPELASLFPEVMGGAGGAGGAGGGGVSGPSVLTPEQRVFLSQGALNDEEQATLQELQTRRTPAGEQAFEMEQEGKAIEQSVGNMMQAPWIAAAMKKDPGRASTLVQMLRKSMLDMAKMMQQNIAPSQEIIMEQEQLRDALKNMTQPEAPFTVGGIPMMGSNAGPDRSSINAIQRDAARLRDASAPPVKQWQEPVRRPAAIFEKF